MTRAIGSLLLLGLLACSKKECPKSTSTDGASADATGKTDETDDTDAVPLFTCVARMRMRNWDGKYSAQVRNHSYCSTKPFKGMCDTAARVQVSMEKGQYENIVSTACFTTEHAYCFALVVPPKNSGSDRHTLRRILHDDVVGGTAQCFLSWYECNEEWNGRHEMDHLPFEEAQAEVESRLTKTECEAY